MHLGVNRPWVPLEYERVRGCNRCGAEPPPVPDPDVEIGRGGHPDPEIRGGPGLPNFFFGPSGLSLV